MAVLSIQSHVVYGYAGNTAAVFPMQRLGRTVWAVNTVEFSNHTGYGSWKGKVLGAELINDLVLGLEERGVLDRCQAVLSGYLGDESTGDAVINAVKKARALNPSAVYCCDPVMGDTGRGIYVKPGIPSIFKNNLLPAADIACPNQFEIENITGIEVKNISGAVNAIEKLHKIGPSIVLVTSYKETDGEISMLASDKKNIYKITTPELPLGCDVAGTGDMTTAIFLSRYLETKSTEIALELCASSVYGILEASFKEFNTNGKKAPLELNIIDAQSQLCSPSYNFKAVKVL